MDIYTDDPYLRGYQAGFKEARAIARASREEAGTHNGFQSANGVMDYGPDAVIVDGDWLQFQLDKLAYYESGGLDD
jgi:hypothetical protein